MELVKFKLFNSKSTYTARLNTVNAELGFPSKKYSKIINGERRNFVSDKIMTRTWAEENPVKTKLNQFPLPVDESMEKDFIGLVDYDENWFDLTAKVQ